MTEAAVRGVYLAWAAYRMYTRCYACEEITYCGRAKRGGRWLCLECFDQAPEGRRAFRATKP